MNLDEYRKMAEVEDRMWYFRSLHGHVARELRARGLRNGAEILDAGCGTGGLILRAQQLLPGTRWTGVDFMPIACELARARCGADVVIREGSVTALPFAAESFDAVVSADVVCQIENPEVAFAEFFRVLRPNGILYINVPAYMWMWSYHDDTVHTKHRYTRREVAGLLRAADFTDAKLSHWNALPFPAIWARRKLFRSANDTSDVKDYPAAVDAIFSSAMALEHAWLRCGGRWAWGTSVMAVARKPATRTPAASPAHLVSGRSS